MWKAKLKDGKEVSELNSKWDDIKDGVTELSLITPNNQIISLPKNVEYIQFKSGSCLLNSNGIEIESRVIGFKINGTIVKIRVDEKTNNITVEL